MSGINIAYVYIYIYICIYIYMWENQWTYSAWVFNRVIPCYTVIPVDLEYYNPYLGIEIPFFTNPYFERDGNPGMQQGDWSCLLRSEKISVPK